MKTKKEETRITPSQEEGDSDIKAVGKEAFDLKPSATSFEPRKTYYSISEVCSMTGLEPHVLRYWESEFPQLRPKKNRAGNRAYREKDIEIINDIKHLLYVEQYTIAGAKKKLAFMRETQGSVQTELSLDPTAASPACDVSLQETEVVTDRAALIRELRQLLQFIRAS